MMALPSCANLTYKQIWQEYRRLDYYKVDEYELLRIHNKWKALGSSVWKGVVFK